MPPPTTYTICGVHLTESEALLVSFIMYGLGYQQAADCLGLEYGTVKNKMHKIESSCGVHNLRSFIAKAADSGFDDKGSYHGHTLLTTHHFRLIKRHAPQVYYDKGIP